MKEQRDKISKGVLVRAFPVGRWAGFESVNLNIIKSSFDRRMKNLTDSLIEWRVVGVSNQFRIKDNCLSALLAQYPLRPKLKPVKVSKVSVNAVLSKKEIKELEFHNLFMNA